MEKLIPFDFEAFKKDPARLRHYVARVAPNWAEPVRGNVVVEWAGGEVCAYSPADFINFLRLAAKTRIVRVRLYTTSDGGTGRAQIAAATNAQDPTFVDSLTNGGLPWVSDPVEVEVQE